MDIDCVFLTLAVGRNTYFVASEHITRKKFVYSLIKRFFKVILYTKGGNGVETVKSVLSVIKNGENVILFPEGNRSFNGSTCYIDPSVAKLVKISNADLITYKLNGAYFASPRWSDKTFSNGIKGELSGYYSSSDIKGMTLDSVYDSIVKDLNYNDYQTNQGKRIRLSATGLESMLFVCPKCHSKSSLTSNKKGIFCSCGYNLKMSNGYLFDSIGNSYSIFDLDEIDKTELKTMIKDNDRLFSDEVLVSYINRDHSISNSYNAVLNAFNDRLEIDSKVLRFDQLSGLSIHSKNTLIINSSDLQLIEICGNERFNALKYVYLYRLVTTGRIYL